MKKKTNQLKSYASSTLSEIRSECKKNEDGEFMQTSYKPLLCESMDFGSRRKSSFKKQAESTRYKTNTYSNPFNNIITEKIVFNTSALKSNQTHFLKELYKQKIKDLKTYYNKKQQQIFVNRLESQINDDKFEAIQCDLGINCVNIIAKYLKISQIKTLILDKNPFGDDGIKKLCKIFSKMQLVTLSLVSVNITNKGGKELIHSIVGIPSLENINFSSPEGFNRNRINPQGIQGFIEVFQHSDCALKNVNLANVSMGEKGFIYFCEGLSEQNTTLETLNLSMNDIRINNDSLNFHKKKLSLLNLKKLDLSQNKMEDTSFELFGDILGINYGRNSLSVNLKELNLSKNNIKSYNSEAFCLQLVKNKTMTHLILNNNNLSEGSCFYHFKYMLSHNWTITHLSLRNCFQSQLDLKILGEGVKQSHSLISLDVSYNSFDQDIFMNFISQISQSKTLKILKMDSCNIIDSYIERTQRFLKANKSIQSIDLSNNYINDKGGRNLLRLVMQNHRIYEMKFRKNCLSTGVMNEIEYMLKQNQISRTFAEPDMHYYNLIEHLQEEQMKSLEDNIENLEKKMEKAKLLDLVQDIVEKQSEIATKIQAINQEKKSLQSIEKIVNKKEDNFMITQ